MSYFTDGSICDRFMADKFICKQDVARMLCYYKFFDIVIQYTSDINSTLIRSLKAKCELAAAKPTCSLLAKHAQIFRQLSARITMNSFVKFDRRSHHFIDPLIRIDPFKSSVRLNERVPLSGGLKKNPDLLIYIIFFTN